MEKKEDIRKRHFATIVYPDSAPEDWMEILKGLHIKGAISPIHDRDKIETGENKGKNKKPHYHVVLTFQGKQNADNVKKICESFGGVGLEIVSNLQGYVRYLTHMDDINKAQYDSEEVIALSGFDYEECILQTSDVKKIVRDIERFIEDNGIIYYSDICEYARENEPEWHMVITSKRTFHFLGFLKSQDYKKKELRKRKYYQSLGLGGELLDLVCDGTIKLMEALNMIQSNRMTGTCEEE